MNSKPIFEKVQRELETGERQTVKYKENAEIMKGDLFILDGQKVVVADLGERFVSDYGRPDRRLRVVYDNGTESDLLLRSLQRALYKDKASRRITESGFGPLFSEDEEEGDLATGYIYVLRSKSEHPFVAEHRISHSQDRRDRRRREKPNCQREERPDLSSGRRGNRRRHTNCANVNRKALEALLHKFFGAARLDLELKDRFGSQVEPREWFLVPLPVIDEAIQKIKEGTIGGFRYDPETARLTQA